MEITGVNSKAYTSAAAAVEEDEELQEAQEEQTKEYGVSVKEKDFKKTDKDDYDSVGQNES